MEAFKEGGALIFCWRRGPGEPATYRNPAAFKKTVLCFIRYNVISPSNRVKVDITQYWELFTYPEYRDKRHPLSGASFPAYRQA